jgi:hypothetical protein
MMTAILGVLESVGVNELLGLDNGSNSVCGINK